MTERDAPLLVSFMAVGMTCGVLLGVLLGIAAGYVGILFAVVPLLLAGGLYWLWRQG